MFALYRKELRSLWPLGLLAFLFMAADLLYRPFTERLDELAWEEIASYLEPGEGGSFSYILMVLVAFVAYSAFPREHDERTIELLYALPLRRSSIFFAKVGAGLTVLTFAEVGLVISDGAQSAFDHQSLGGDHFDPRVAATFLFLELSFCFVVYAHALFASVFRLLGLLPYVLLLFLVAIIDDVVPGAAWVDPTELLSARYEASTLLISWLPLSLHLAVAAIALAVSYFLWLGPAEWIGHVLEQARASLVGRIAAGCAAVIVFGFLALFAVAMVEVEPPGPEGEAASFETAGATTERYVFTYPVSHEARARALIDVADTLHAGVQRELGADPGPRLIADLTEVSSDHLGIASWTHVRVGLVGESDPVRLRATFTHETTHAFQARLSDRRQSDAGRATRFFGEGSAEYVAYEVVPNEAARTEARWMGVAAFTRHRMTTEDLIDDQRLTARFDTLLTYSLGELWSAVLVETCGHAAIGDALRAFARPDAPRDLTPHATWEDTLRVIGCDYESVDAAFIARVEALSVAHADEIDALPRIGGGVSGGDSVMLTVTAQLDRDGPPDATYVLSVRSSAEATDTEVIRFTGRVSPSDPRRVTFSVLKVLIPSARFQLSFAVVPDASHWGFSEPWQWATSR